MKDETVLDLQMDEIKLLPSLKTSSFAINLVATIKEMKTWTLLRPRIS